MKSVFAGLVLCRGAAAAKDEHPIGKVIVMLQGLSETTKAEGQTEEVTYAKFEHWCKNSAKTLDAAIAEEKSQISSLTDEISAKTEQSATLNKEIDGLTKNIEELDKEQAEADDLRSKTASLFTESNADHASTIKAIEDAIAALSGAKDATSSLAQKHVRTVLALVATSATETQLQGLQAVLEDRPDVKAAGDASGHVKKYNFKSGNVVELLKQLLMSFEDEKLAIVKAETNSLNANELTTDARQNAKTAAQKSKDGKTDELAATDSELAAAKDSLKETKDDLDADSTSLSDAQKQCALKASEWSERTGVRKGELEAIGMAIKILAKVSGVRTEAPGNPVPPASPVAFFQLSKGDDPRSRAVQLLRAEAHETHSNALERLAQQIAVHQKGPFQDVINMIQKMIFRLNDEQKDEDNHKNWCDQEIEKSDTSHANKEEKISDLTAKVDAMTATVVVLTDDLKNNADMMASIVAHVAEATDIRNTGKKENAAALKDAKAAENAIANAVAVLEQFYKDSGAIEKKDYELVQRGVDLPAEPSTWDASYTGVSDPAAQPGGIVTVLEETAADFARMGADTEAQEASDQAAFDEDMKANKIEKARRSKESEMKEQEKKRLVDKTAAAAKNRKQVSTELEAVQQYIKDLQPACVDGDSSYEDRKANRAKEIDALKQAQGILGDHDAGAFLAPVHRTK